MRNAGCRSAVWPLALLIAAPCLLAFLTAGCGHKEPEPSAPGYYSGPFKGKAKPTGGNQKGPASNPGTQ
ncbi:MAG TPA: hypothetical protein VFB38_23140 [Chthonomonadaceae bacterium]|nr:hypothetical protein [Chthonomonadaceae bacterium]